MLSGPLTGGALYQGEDAGSSLGQDSKLGAITKIVDLYFDSLLTEIPNKLLGRTD